MIDTACFSAVVQQGGIPHVVKFVVYDVGDVGDIRGAGQIEGEGGAVIIELVE